MSILTLTELKTEIKSGLGGRSDLDQAMDGHSMDSISASRGYDDPFVRSTVGGL